MQLANKEFAARDEILTTETQRTPSLLTFFSVYSVPLWFFAEQ